MKKESIDDIQIDLLLQAILRAYGYDFSNYAKSSLKRRLQGFIQSEKISTYLSLADNLLKDPILFERLLKQMSITVTEMFRDPYFYSAFRERIIPILKTYPYLKIWHAGCATGEEVYSMAILLHEEGYLNKTTIYATDFNNEALDIAKKGIYSAEHMKEYIKNYNAFGGKSDFSEYYTSNYGSIKLHDFLKKSITFANHNLVTDGRFGEMNVIFCRNVMIYFDRELTDRVLKLFESSLCPKGFLCLGTKETLNFSGVSSNFDTIDEKTKLYQRKF